jgi:glycosyltransferase involved in cell wall biosynthesis
MSLDLTILIAVRNGEDFLEKTLISTIDVALETGATLLVSDNHSHDRTSEILQKYRDSILIIRPPELLGMAEHWTWATTQVSSKYVRLIGHDDFLNANNVKDQVNKLESNVKALAVYSDRDYLLTMKNGKEIKRKSRGKRDHKLNSQSDLLLNVLRTGTNGVGEPFCVTFRTDLFKRSINRLTWSARDPIYELETYLNVLKYGEIIFCEGKAGLYRVHPNSYSSNLSKYFWQASQHRIWVKEKLAPRDLTCVQNFILNITTRCRALIRALVFWWIK